MKLESITYEPDLKLPDDIRGGGGQPGHPGTPTVRDSTGTMVIRIRVMGHEQSCVMGLIEEMLQR